MMMYKNFGPRGFAQIAMLIVLGLMLGGCSRCRNGNEGAVTGGGVTPPAPPPPTVTNGGGTKDVAPPDSMLPSRLDANTPVKESGSMNRVYFDFDRAALRADQMATLEANAKYLLDNPKLRIIIEGHCDERGTREYNLNLGQQRAMSVIDYLVKAGVAPDRLYPISYGKEKPEALGHNEESWGKNRRCVFMVPIAQ